MSLTESVRDIFLLLRYYLATCFFPVTLTPSVSGVADATSLKEGGVGIM